MIEIYRRGFGYFVRSLPVLLVVAGLVEGLTLAFPYPGIKLITALTLIEMAYHFHRHFLFAERFTWIRPTRPRIEVRSGWFLVATIGLVLVHLGLTIAGARATVGPPGNRPA